MPAEEQPHAATWMCFPANADVWGRDLRGVQESIASIALAIAGFEAVRMLVRPESRAMAADLVGSDVELIDGPVDDLWARDTLPLFLVGAVGELAAGRVRFNGWGNKQVHDGDAQLAGLVADILGVPLLDSRVTGEGGGLENDGKGTLLAARSSWVNDNRNPGVSDADIAAALVATPAPTDFCGWTAWLARTSPTGTSTPWPDSRTRPRSCTSTRPTWSRARPGTTLPRQRTTSSGRCGPSTGCPTTWCSSLSRGPPGSPAMRSCPAT